jgi:integrase
MPKQALNDKFIKSVVVEKDTEYFDTTTSGLFLRVSPSGRKIFGVRYFSAEGKQRRYTLGDYKNIGLAQARSMLYTVRDELNKGIDPRAEIEKKKVEAIEAVRNQYTFSDLSRDFIHRHLPTLRPKTSTEYKRIINNILIPEFGKLPVESIRRRDMFTLHEKIGVDQGKARLANLTKSVASRMFNYAIEREYIETNPVANIKALKAGKVRRERYYNDDEIKALWHAFETQAEPMNSYFKLLILTGQRRTETLNARWDNIDFDKLSWKIPASDAKNKTEHIVPLSKQVVDLLLELHQLTGDSVYVFESSKVKGKPLNWTHKAVNRIKAMSGISDFRLHDLRRTVTTNLAQLGIDRTVLGKIINHKGIAGDDSVTAIYDRNKYSKEIQRALQLWAYKVDSIINEDENEIRVTKIA